MSIYITGDTHGDLDIQKLSFANWPDSRGLTREDILIIAGDFGLPFFVTDIRNYEAPMDWYAVRSNKTYHYWIEWLSKRPYTVLFIDGNHDCHPLWDSRRLPPIDMFGGKVQQHPDADNVFHLMRGEYYTIQRKTFWTMGGADSPDKYMRTEGISWWREEIPSAKEMDYGLKNLQRHDYKVDYIVTHTMPQNLISPVLGEHYEADAMTKYLNIVLERTTFDEWYCGHFHQDLTYLDDFTVSVLYNTIRQIV